MNISSESPRKQIGSTSNVEDTSEPITAAPAESSRQVRPVEQDDKHVQTLITDFPGVKPLPAGKTGSDSDVEPMDSEMSKSGDDGGPAGTSRRKRQTHFDPRAFGTAKSNGPAAPTEPNSKLALREIYDRKVGTNASTKARDGAPIEIDMSDEEVEEQYKKQEGVLTSNYRAGQAVYRRGAGGSGLDEQISAASTARIRTDLVKEGFTPKEVDALVGKMSMERT